MVLTRNLDKEDFTSIHRKVEREAQSGTGCTCSGDQSSPTDWQQQTFFESGLGSMQIFEMHFQMCFLSQHGSTSDMSVLMVSPGNFQSAATSVPK